MLLLRRREFVSSLIAGSWIVCARQACAERPALVDHLADPSERPARYTPTATSPTSLPEDHPLAPVLRFARDEQNYLRRAVRDFTCRLVKRERIDGILQDYCHIDMSVREEVRGGDAIGRPMSIYLQFLAPRNVAGRRVLYVAGQNEGKMLVRNGGRHFDYVVVEVDPLGESARKESLVPITQSGFNQVLGQMIDILQRHAQADPTGQNTRVQRIAAAKVNQRPCTAIRIVHPKKQDGLEFHVANVFIDDELRVPVRVDFSDWPKQSNQPPPLMAEYTYTNLKLNVNLSDRAFSPSLLRGNR
jgi:hypothetical protein